MVIRGSVRLRCASAVVAVGLVACGVEVERPRNPDSLILELGGRRPALRDVLAGVADGTGDRDATARDDERPRAELRPRPKAPRYAELGDGETLGQLSQRTLGTWRRWTEIAELNGIEDVNSVSAGTRLKLPVD